MAIAAIAQCRRQRAVFHGEFEDIVVDRLRGDAGADQIVQVVEALRRQLAGLAHSGKSLRPVEADVAGVFQRGRRGVDVAYHGSCDLECAWAGYGRPGRRRQTCRADENDLF